MNIKVFLAVVLFFAVNVSYCSASEYGILGYLDPGSGAMIFQMIIASIVGAGVAVKLFWRNIIDFFKGNKGASQEDNDIVGGEKE